MDADLDDDMVLRTVHDSGYELYDGPYAHRLAAIRKA